MHAKVLRLTASFCQLSAKDAHHSVALKRTGGRFHVRFARSIAETAIFSRLINRKNCDPGTLPVPHLTCFSRIERGDRLALAHAMSNSKRIVYVLRSVAAPARALKFERYLKSGSGCAFAKRHLR
jgi:hypothetical protein